MQKTESKLTVYFDDPFWVGVYERISDGLLKVCKITFGAEPKDYEVYEYLLRNWHLLRFVRLSKRMKSRTQKSIPNEYSEKLKNNLKRRVSVQNRSKL